MDFSQAIQKYATQPLTHQILLSVLKDYKRPRSQKNAFTYLLFLRLIPIFPFWAVTLVPGLLGVSLRSFFFATLIGIIPGTFVYALLGNGLGTLLEQGQAPNLGIIFNPEIFIPLCGLALLSLVPLIYKRIKKR